MIAAAASSECILMWVLFLPHYLNGVSTIDRCLLYVEGEWPPMQPTSPPRGSLVFLVHAHVPTPAPCRSLLCMPRNNGQPSEASAAFPWPFISASILSRRHRFGQFSKPYIMSSM